MHNVISLASSFGKQNERGLAFKEGCFETLFLQGFWKKLVYMLDVDSSLQLSMAVFDYQGYKLNFLVEKLGISDLIAIEQALHDHNKFNQHAKTAKI